MKGEHLQPRYLTLEQAGVYLGNRKPEAVRWWCRTGKIPHIKVDKCILIDKEDIDKVMRQHKVAA